MGKIPQLNWSKITPTSFIIHSVLVALLSISPWLSAMDDDNKEGIHPEIATKKQGIKKATSNRAMAVTANPYATDTAIAILQKGGSAIDAAIAAQLVLNLVEPQSSGIGGGGFLLYFDHKKQRLTHFNGRETAPRKVDENFFMISKNKPMPFFDAVVGGYAVGVPGLLAMMDNAHKLHGKLPWAMLFEPAITLARQGFVISERLHQSLAALSKSSKGVSNEALFRLFYQTNGKPKPVGSLLKNPEFARTLSLIANNGARYFYNSELTESMVEAVRKDKNKPGVLTEKDFATYKSPVEQALCHKVKGYKLCGAPPPSSGAFTVIETLNLLTSTPEFTGLKYDSVGFYHRFIESTKLAFADRNKFMADPNFVDIPLRPLLSSSFKNRRLQKLPLLKASAIRQPAGMIKDADFVQVSSPNMPSTTHLSIVDTKGNIVSMTTSIEHAFGSRILVRGFLLNNQLTDFSFTPRTVDNKKIANRIEPEKRPRSSMAPMIIFNDKQSPVLVIGSPGGSWIIPYVAKTIAQHLYLDAELEDAINSDHIGNLNRETTTVEENTTASTIQALQTLGHKVQARPLTSGIHAIKLSKEQLIGVADSRREGTAKGL